MLALLMLFADPTAVSAADEARVRARAQPVLDRFSDAVRACGARPPFKPRLTVEQRDGIIHYDQPTGVLHLYPWSVIGGEARAAMIRQAGSTGVDPQAAYEDVFNDLLVAHELGHWLQGFQPERRTAAGQFDNWFAEQNANRLTVAFWREHPAAGRPSEARLRAAAGPEGANPTPPPAGTSIEDYFTAHTMTIVRARVMAGIRA